uniref:IRS-type PTB domain-containing protein n=1 Tax=Toxocara canis TaxID=6265 RepID=A0A183VF87_TOXCA
LNFSRCAMTAVRDTLCNLRPLEIPRPHIPGLQFIPTRGRLGFYRSIRREGAQYGIQIKAAGPRRPALADACWGPIESTKETNAESSRVSSLTDNATPVEQQLILRQQNTMTSSDEDSSHPSNYSDESPKGSSLDEPEYPEPDYDTVPNVKTKPCNTDKTKF